MSTNPSGDDEDRRNIGHEPNPTDVEATFAAYGRRCYSLALRVVRDRHLAHDVVQDVFETVHRQANSFGPTRGTLATWRLSLTHHKAVDVVRKRQVHTRLDFAPDVLSDLADRGPAPEEVSCSRDECARLRGALRELRPVERDVIVLAYYDGCSQSTIADLLHIPLGTVKSRTASGMRRLHQNMDAS